MQCPKCGGEAYLVDEELVQVLENVDPPRIVAKAIYQCRSCGERFTRLVTETLDSKRKELSQTSQASSQPQQPTSGYPGDKLGSVSPDTRDRIERLKFF